MKVLNVYVCVGVVNNCSNNNNGNNKSKWRCVDARGWCRAGSQAEKYQTVAMIYSGMEVERGITNARAIVPMLAPKCVVQCWAKPPSPVMVLQ